MNLAEAREAFVAARDKFNEARATLAARSSDVDTALHALEKISRDRANVTEERDRLKGSLREAAEAAGASLLAEAGSKFDAAVSNESDMLWSGFVAARKSLDAYNKHVREVDILDRDWRATLTEAGRARDEALEFVKASERSTAHAIYQVRRLLHAEVSGMCGASAERGADLGNDPGNEPEIQEAQPQAVAE